MDEATQEFKYLAIKNWRKYQGSTLTHSNARRPWVKDWLDKDADPDYSELTCLQRYVLDGVRRLRGRFECNPPADGVWIARALSVDVRERHCIPSAIRRLVALGFLIPTNQRLDSDSLAKAPVRGEMRGDEMRGDELSRGESPPANGSAASSPDGSKPDQNRPQDDAPAPDVAIPLEPARRVLEAPGYQETTLEGLTVHQLARGMMETLGIAGGQSDLGIWSQAIQLKARRSGMPIAEAYRFILAKAEEAQELGEFSKPTFWMKDAAFDQKPRRSKTHVATDEYGKRLDRELEILRASNGKSA